MVFWKKVKRDIQRGIKEGVSYVTEGATAVKKRVKRLTKERKNIIKLYELQSQVQKEMAELGGRIYDLSSKKKNPMLDRKVQTISARINRLEAKIARLENRIKKAPKKVSQKRITKPTRKKRTTSQK